MPVGKERCVRVDGEVGTTWRQTEKRDNMRARIRRRPRERWGAGRTRMTDAATSVAATRSRSTNYCRYCEQRDAQKTAPRAAGEARVRPTEEADLRGEGEKPEAAAAAGGRAAYCHSGGGEGASDVGRTYRRLRARAFLWNQRRQLSCSTNACRFAATTAKAPLLYSARLERRGRRRPSAATERGGVGATAGYVAAILNRARDHARPT